MLAGGDLCGRHAGGRRPAQFFALMAENGVLLVDEAAQAALAQRIRENL